MRKFTAFFTNNLRLYLKTLPSHLAVFVILPIAFILMMSFGMSGLDNATSREIDINLTIDNQDQGDYGDLLVQTIESEPLSQYFNLKDDASIKVSIPKNFSNQLSTQPLLISTKGEPKMSSLEIVKTFLHNWHQELIRGIKLDRASQSLSDQEKANLMMAFQELQIINPSEQVEKTAVETEKRLNSVEKYLVSGLIFCLITGLSAVTTLATKDEFSGLLKRLKIAPLSVGQRTLFNWISDGFILLINVSLILVLMSFHPQVDASHFLECIPWLLVFVGFFQATGMFMASVLPKSGIQIFIQCIVMFFIFAGMFPLGEVLGGSLKTFLSTNWFQIYMIKPLQESILGNSVNHSLIIMASYLLLTFLFLGLTYLADRRKENIGWYNT